MLESEVMRASVIVTETFPDRFYCHNLLSRVQPHLIQFTSSFGRFFYGEFTDCWVGRCFISVLLTVVPLLATFAGCLACLPVTCLPVTLSVVTCTVSTQIDLSYR